jgi:hypothetical protein
VDIGLEIPREGDYEIAVRYTTSWDYGIVQASLDGKPMGEPADCYAPDVRLRDLLPLGTAHLTAGEHVLRFQAVDKNKESRGQGYLMGINYVTVREAK